MIGDIIQMMLGVVAGLGCYLAGRHHARWKKCPEIDTSFKCPYCEIVVTGMRELDKINHLQCLKMSASDLEAEKKRRATEGGYTVNIIKKISSTYRDGYHWSQDNETGDSFCYEWTVKQGENIIDYGKEFSQTRARSQADAAIKLRKDLQLTYEVEA